ncbi:AI-2E family transporter [Candidatus Saccharibacteria bacterium]|nr:AI-2E family transporter [Candidatus Saccharibacteria bacterium]
MAKKIETDFWTIVQFWSVPLIAYLIYLFLGQAATGLIMIGVSIFLALALKPLVRKVNGFFTKHFGMDKKHQSLSAVFAYLIVVIVIGGIVAIVGPVVVNETTKFVQHFPETFDKTFGGWDGINNFGNNIGIANLQEQITNVINGISKDIMGIVGNNLVSSVSGIADIMMKIVLVLILTLLFLLEGPEMIESLWRTMGNDTETNGRVAVMKRTVSEMANVVSTYVSRQILVAMVDGLASGLIVFLLSLFLGVSSSLAIPMGMITMLFYLIPMFGQFIGGTLVTILLVFSNPVAGLVFAIVYIIYAQIENNIISPKIQGDALNLRPVTILCAITIGMYMFGLLGAIIAIPIAGCIRVLFDEYPNIKSAKGKLNAKG